MLDLKTMKSALEQLEQERKIPREKIIDAIEQALAAAYKKDYGKKGQIIRNKIDIETGEMEFYQVKIVVDESLVRMTKEDDEEEEIAEDDDRVRFNEEHHILLEDAKKIKSNVKLEEEMVFPLDNKDDYGRIAAQTAKQVIIQKIREAERSAIVDEYGSKEGEIINGTVEKVERGIVYIDFNRATGIILPEEQIPGEFYKLSRTHPQLIEGLFAMEAPEIAGGVVEIKSIAREAGARSKIAVYSNDEHVDPVGSCVGQKGVRVSTVMNELNGEKIDIIPWSADPATYIASAISPANVLNIQVFEQEHKASIEVAVDQLSLAIGKGGQNVRLAAKLTGWRIDIKGMEATGDASKELSEEDILDGGIVDDGTDEK
ncbi:MAG: NusA antitermination factor [Candidatus Nomurabacteria bacterium GW2011_GWC2_36_9]|nr:MAG: NusA antitermination factor [Candidatus Nomurabacteria bacterium GW2011_GWC2_36_9]